MNDTPRRIDRKFRAMMLQRTGEERLKMGCSMHATAQALAKAYLSARYPGARPGELKRLLFLHFYASDFEPEERKRIALALAKRGRGDGKVRNLLMKSTVVNFSGSNAVRDKAGTYGRKRKDKAKRPRPRS